jgi:hypothetical protein
MKARSKSPGVWIVCGGFLSFNATRMVVSGVAAGAAVPCESTRSALAIAIFQFFSI